MRAQREKYRVFPLSTKEKPIKEVKSIEAFHGINLKLNYMNKTESIQLFSKILEELKKINEKQQDLSNQLTETAKVLIKNQHILLKKIEEMK